MTTVAWLAAILFGLSIGGLGYSLLRAFSAGADAYSSEYSMATAREFEDIFLFIPPKRILEAAWTVAGIFFLLGFLLTGDLSSTAGAARGAVVGILLGIAGLRMPDLLLRWLRSRRLDRFNLQLVDALTGMSNALKAGFSITQSFESVERASLNPIAQEFGVFLHETRVGVKFETGLANMVRRVGSDDLELVATAIETARMTGGNLTEVFDSIASTIRERMRIERRIKTLTAQGRLQGIVIGVMPIVLLFALVAIDPEMTLPFLKSAVGAGVMLLVAVMLTCGGLMIRKIIRIDV